MHENIVPVQSLPNQVGRYVVATRDISAHEVILRDEVGVVGPNHDTYPVCMECLLPVDGSFLCPECNLPLCNEACYEKRGYHSAECELLKATPSGFRINVDFDRRKYVRVKVGARNTYATRLTLHRQVSEQFFFD